MKIEHDALVLVTDGSKVLLFRNEGDEKFPVFETVTHEIAENPASRNQGTDTPGRVQSSMGDRRSSYGETDWHQQSEDRFARHAAELLEDAVVEARSGPVIVAAAPRTLGELRKQYGRQTRERLQFEIAKDLTNMETDEIIEVLTSQSDS